MIKEDIFPKYFTITVENKYAYFQQPDHVLLWDKIDTKIQQCCEAHDNFCYFCRITSEDVTDMPIYDDLVKILPISREDYARYHQDYLNKHVLDFKMQFPFNLRILKEHTLPVPANAKYTFTFYCN